VTNAMWLGGKWVWLQAFARFGAGDRQVAALRRAAHHQTRLDPARTTRIDRQPRRGRNWTWSIFQGVRDNHQLLSGGRRSPIRRGRFGVFTYF
jgi:hypothetical protein